MNLVDPASLVIVGLIATVVSLVFAFAAHAATKRRQQDRQRLIMAASPLGIPPPAPSVPGPEAGPEPVAEGAAAMVTQERPTGAIATPAAQPPPGYSGAAPQGVPTAPRRASESVFRRYVARAGLATPTAEAPPEDNPPDGGYRWE